jgi:hypothetical protein
MKEKKDAPFEKHKGCGTPLSLPGDKLSEWYTPHVRTDSRHRNTKAWPTRLDAYYSLSMGEEAADEAAAGLYPGLFGPTGNVNSLNQFGTALIGSTYNQAITNGSGTERISIRYITPIPAIDLIGKTPAQRQEIANDAGSRVTGVTFVPPKQQ